MSPENTHKLMGFYMEVLILGVNTMYMLFCFFRLFLIGCIGLIKAMAGKITNFFERMDGPPLQLPIHWTSAEPPSKKLKRAGIHGTFECSFLLEGISSFFHCCQKPSHFSACALSLTLNDESSWSERKWAQAIPSTLT